ncbi:MAG: outer membrane protein assembly factor BamE [Chlamydiae bacterium]|nr:outer membrane protein assembly factor BamE [Chlamydiota bacterium]
MRLKSVMLGFFMTLLLCNCASYDFSRRVVKQGNLLPEPTLQRLKIGMSKEDVGTLLGTSLLSPTFNNDRWDYAFTVRKGLGFMVKKHVSLYFNHDRLSAIEKKP